MRETTEMAIPASNSVRAVLDAQPWENIYQRLAAYANSLIKHRIWRGEWGGAVPGGHEAVDFAGEAIVDVYTGKRRWDPDKYPELIKYLFMVVESKISNATQRAENRDTELPEDDEVGYTVDSDETYYWALHNYLKDEPLLQRAVECIFDGYDDRATMAARLNIDTSEMTNLRKRLSRRLTDFRRLLSNEEKRS